MRILYASDRQIIPEKEESSVKSDIYAVGILMNVMLTGKLPKEEKAEGEIGRIIEKCISWEPDDRYSAGELIETLKEFIHA